MRKAGFFSISMSIGQDQIPSKIFLDDYDGFDFIPFQPFSIFQHPTKHKATIIETLFSTYARLSSQQTHLHEIHSERRYPNSGIR